MSYGARELESWELGVGLGAKAVCYMLYARGCMVGSLNPIMLTYLTYIPYLTLLAVLTYSSQNAVLITRSCPIEHRS